MHKLKYNKTHHKTHFILGTDKVQHVHLLAKMWNYLKIFDIQRTVHRDIFL